MRFGEVKKLSKAPQLWSGRSRIWPGCWGSLIPRPVMESWGRGAEGYRKEPAETHRRKTISKYTWKPMRTITLGLEVTHFPQLLFYLKQCYCTIFTIRKNSNKNKRKSKKETKIVFDKNWKDFHVISHQGMLTDILCNTYKIHKELLYSYLLDMHIFIIHVTMDVLVGQRILLLAA